MAYKFYTLQAHPTNFGKRRELGGIKYIVIHYTANDGDKAVNNAKYFSSRQKLGASAHYFVDDSTVYQSVPDNYVAWSVGGGKWKTGGGRLYGTVTNYNSISIELCDTVKNGTVAPTDATVQNALDLTRELMRKYNIPKDRVIRHYDVNGKPCPKYWVSDSAWKSEFHDRLQGASASSIQQNNKPAPPPVSNEYKVKVLVSDLNIRKGPSTSYGSVGHTGKGVFTIVETSGNWGRLKSGAGWIYLGNSSYAQRVG